MIKYFDSTSVTSQHRLNGVALTNESPSIMAYSKRKSWSFTITEGWLWLASYSVPTMEPKPIFGAKWIMSSLFRLFSRSDITTAHLSLNNASHMIHQLWLVTIINNNILSRFEDDKTWENQSDNWTIVGATWVLYRWPRVWKLFKDTLHS